MARKTLITEQVLTALAETPQRIAELTDGLTLDQLHAVPAPDEWSANDVLAHLRACADVWGNCITERLEPETPTLRAVNPRMWIKQTNYRKQKIWRSLRAFAAQRASLVAVLELLPSKAWTRKATVTGAGKPLERTVLFYAQWLARHERPHLKQIERIVNTLRFNSGHLSSREKWNYEKRPSDV